MLSWSNNENKLKVFNHCIDLSLIIFVLHLFTPYTDLVKYKKNKNHAGKLPILFNC